MMNQKVKELSLTHTHFSNPIGKDEENYSSAHDIAKIMEYCLKNKTFKEIISTNYYKYDDLDIEISGPLYGSLEKYGIDLSIVNGAKSGYTTEAKHCLVSYSEAKDTKYIVVTNQANDYKELLNDTFNIYNYFYTNYDYFNYDIDFNIDIENGKESKYSVKLSPKLYLNKDFDQSLITYKYNGTKKITFLKNKGDKLGSVSIYYDKDLIKTVDVKLNSDLKFKSKAYTKVIISFIIILIVLVLAILGLFKFKTKKNKKVKTITNVKVQPKTDNFTILKTTTNIKLFFETIKKINNSEKEKIEHDFIDRCFKNIDFKNEKDLKKLNEDLKTHKEEMCTTTVKYYNTLFKYCIKKYINNN